jgi:putative ATP-binding cassette transporter
VNDASDRTAVTRQPPGVPRGSASKTSAFALFFPSKPLLVASLLLTSLSSFATVALISIINQSIARGVLEVPLFVGLCVVVVAAAFAGKHLSVRMLESSAANIRILLAQRILALPMKKIEEMGRHRLVSTVGDDVFTITNGFGPTILVFVTNSTIIVGCIVYLGWLSSKLLFFVLPLFVPVALSTVAYSYARRWHGAAIKQRIEISKQLEATVDGAKELKLNRRRREALLSVRLRRAVDQFRELNLKLGAIFPLTEAVTRLIYFVALAVVILVAGQGRREEFFGYLVTLSFMIDPIRQVAGVLPSFAQLRSALAHLDAVGLLDDHLEGDPTEPWRRPEARCDRLELAGVTYAYGDGGDGGFTLGPIDLTVRGGEVLMIAGGNGSGKSTLVKILTGLYQPASGSIRLNGELIDSKSQDWFRQHFSTVFSDFFLFDEVGDSGDAGADERARGFLTKLRIADKVSVRDGVVSTTSALSQGQRRRLALVAALMEDRPICVFDEWAADQDPVFKRAFYMELLPELRSAGKAVVVITHDDRYFEVGDRLLTLESGAAREVALESPKGGWGVGPLATPTVTRP